MVGTMQTGIGPMRKHFGEKGTWATFFFLVSWASASPVTWSRARWEKRIELAKES